MKLFSRDELGMFEIVLPLPVAQSIVLFVKVAVWSGLIPMAMRNSFSDIVGILLPYAGMVIFFIYLVLRINQQHQQLQSYWF